MDVVSGGAAAKSGMGTGASSSSTSAHYQSSSTCSLSAPHLPPGFRFHPTDEELVIHYLSPRASSSPLPAPVIAEVDLYKHDPWELPAKSCRFGMGGDGTAACEWYFFSPRDRKYPNGARPNRAATSGYWKATGTDKAIYGSSSSTSGGGRRGVVGVKKALVFYGGKPPRGVKTNWIMHEYRLVDASKPTAAAGAVGNGGGDARRKKNSLRLDDWVLCRIYQKNTHRPTDHDRSPEGEARAATYAVTAPGSMQMPQPLRHQQDKGAAAGLLFQLATATTNKSPASTTMLSHATAAASTNYAGALLGNDETFFEGLLATNDQEAAAAMATGYAAACPADLSLAPTPMPSTKSTWPHHATCTCSTDGGHNSPVVDQTPEYQTHSLLLGAIGDGVIRQPTPYQLSGLNTWNASTQTGL